MKVKELLKRVESEYRRDAEIILSYLLSVPPSQIPLMYEREISKELEKKFLELIEKRKEGTPTAYLIGEWECMGRVFKVREGVLIPRPETEILIEKTLELIPKDRETVGFELGSGTGCISVNLLIERPKLRMYASDINPEAVNLTEENAKMHGVEKRLTVYLGNAFEPVRGMKFDFIVSNPPYIPENFWVALPEEVKREGYTSLIGGKKGWEFYELIAEEGTKHLKESGFIALEIGHDQGKVVKELLERKGFKVNIFKDYSGFDRVVIAKRWN